MKSLFLAIAILFSSVAVAQTIIPLQRPPEIASTNPYRTTGYWTGFNADDTVHGSVVQIRYYPCSGRDCPSPSSGRAWQVTWDDNGNPTLGPPCAGYVFTTRTRVWIWEPGFNSTNCPVHATYSGNVVVINGVPYDYITTSADGAYELVSNGLVKF